MIKCEYNIKDKILFYLSKKDYQKEIIFGEKIEIILDIPEKDVEDFTENMIKISDNKISINILS